MTLTRLLATGLVAIGVQASAQVPVPEPGPSVVISNLAYTAWSSATIAAAGRAEGSIVISNLSTATRGGIVISNISVTYTGEVGPATQVGGLHGASGINYWEPSTPFLSRAISNAPPISDIITLVGGIGETSLITFSEPVLDPILLIVSLGRVDVEVRYIFDQPFEILSQGPGYWGDGLLSRAEGNVLVGYEGHGAIQFSGPVSSISWTVPDAESWHGFTIGIPFVPSPAGVPEGAPGPWLPLIATLTFIGWAARTRPRSKP
ncbi:MAG: hypothetical protein KF833_22980 [Verrucomicrobiae bacterium]|nr:hypothetical protein [Verrucomicrobiae bacterium]